MTPLELAELFEEYRAGIDAELHLLRQLAEVAERQHQATASSDLGKFGSIADQRDDIMRNLVTLEEELRAMRQTLTDHRDVIAQVPGYEEVAARHREAATVVNSILATDQQSIAALADAELARRAALSSLEKGESTLAAYRRVLSPPVASAKLVDKIG